MEWWPVIAAVLVVLAVTLYRLLKVYDHFKPYGVPYCEAVPFLGSFWKPVLQRIPFLEAIREAYNVDREAKYVGVFDLMTPTIMVRDLDLIKSVTVKNFDHFVDHRTFQTSESELLFSKNLFALRGDRWRDVRNLLSPAFTSSKMKAMFVLMSECAKEYGKNLSSLKPQDRVIELKDAFTRYTNDVIATCAFGVNVNSMKDPKNKFYVLGKEATSFGRHQSLKFFLFRISPWLADLLKIRMVGDDVVEFFKEVVSTTIKTRREKGIVRPDMIQLMMETEGKLGPGKELTIMDMTAQAFVFFFGGFESTSSLMCFAAHEVGINKDIQARLQEEIDEVLERCNGEVTYEAINDMKYLDAVIHEALRMYPVIVAVDRVCVKPFDLEPAVPGAKPYHLKEGDVLWLPIAGIHYDTKYYDEPEKFNPDRFYDDPKQYFNSGALLVFGMGPRMCIGNRFAMLEAKVLLFHIFANCNLIPCSKTTIPIKLNKKGFSMTAEDGFWFDVQPRSDRKTEKVLLLETPVISG